LDEVTRLLAVINVYTRFDCPLHQGEVARQEIGKMSVRPQGWRQRRARGLYPPIRTC